MCNHRDNSATTPHTQDRFGQGIFTLGIDIRCRLVEHHQEGVPVQCPGETDALPRYLNLLKAGGSDYPYELVRAAGVDLATPAPYQALVAQMNAIMDEIESLRGETAH